MTRMARAVAAGLPHHVTRRGNRRQRDLLAPQCRANGVAVWAWCLMPNHIHLVLTPPELAALARMLGDTHRTYTNRAGSTISGRTASPRLSSTSRTRSSRFAMSRAIPSAPACREDGLRRHQRAGHPLGPPAFIAALEQQLGWPLTLRRCGAGRRRRMVKGVSCLWFSKDI